MQTPEPWGGGRNQINLPPHLQNTLQRIEHFQLYILVLNITSFILDFVSQAAETAIFSCTRRKAANQLDLLGANKTEGNVHQIHFPV